MPTAAPPRSIAGKPGHEMIDALAIGDLIAQVDAARSDYDHFKLSVPLANLVAARLAEARAAHAGLVLAGDSAARASERVTESRRRLSALLRSGFEALRAIPEEDAPATDVVQALETYGWERGNLGDIESPSRIGILARAAGRVSNQLPASLRYPAHVVTGLTTWLGVLDANVSLSGGGALPKIIDDASAKHDLLLKVIARVRHHYCAASDDGDKTPELARIGIQPKQKAAATSSRLLPEVPGAATFDPASHRLVVLAMPRRAAYLVAWRKPSGGDAECAGVSIELAVSVCDFSPLRTGVACEFWVTGRNAHGDGPASNRVTFTD